LAKGIFEYRDEEQVQCSSHNGNISNIVMGESPYINFTELKISGVPRDYVQITFCTTNSSKIDNRENVFVIVFQVIIFYSVVSSGNPHMFCTIAELIYRH
jgi:hypothetical protein